MTNRFALAVVALSLSVSASAATLKCATPLRAPDSNWAPVFTMSAEMPETALQGNELNSLSALQVTAGRQVLALDLIRKDELYRPRTNPNRNRFNFDVDATNVEEATPANEVFDGIVHGVILPKRLAPRTVEFKAYVISSTDSYHDGINSYFRMNCEISR